MTEADLLAIVAEVPNPGPPCMMADGRVALLILSPTETSESRDFGFQIPGEEEIEWRPASRIWHVGNGALAEGETESRARLFALARLAGLPRGP